MLELHVWGPVAHLASIDPECLAAVAYLDHAIPSAEWLLIPSSDPSACPANFLPALRHDGTWTSGFGPIVSYLASHTPHASLDAALTPVQRADCLAYGALLAASGRALLDAALYASEDNWVAVTRPAYAALLPFPLAWTTPLSVRAAAETRAARTDAPRLLALLESDLLSGDEEKEACPEPPTVTQRLANRLRGGGGGGGGGDVKTTVSRHLVRQKLEDIAHRFFAPFSELLLRTPEDSPLSGPSFFPGTPVSSLDCLAYGYFSLMIRLELPQPFLRTAAERHPLLARFAADMHASACFGGARAGRPAVAPVRSPPSRLPFRVWDEVLRGIPTLGGEYRSEARRRAAGRTGALGLSRRGAALVLGLVVAGLGLGGGSYAYRTWQPFGSRLHSWSAQRPEAEGKSRLARFGAVGSALGTLFDIQNAEEGLRGGIGTGRRAPAEESGLDEDKTVLGRV